MWYRFGFKMHDSVSHSQDEQKMDRYYQIMLVQKIKLRF